MKIKVHQKSFSGICNQKLLLVFIMTLAGALCKLHAQTQQKECDIRMNAVVSSSGNLNNDGKGTYYTGNDWVAIWVNPTRWPKQSFHMCMNWPFKRVQTCDGAAAPAPTGISDSRTLIHRMTNPMPKEGAKSIGEFTGPGGGNDIALSRPLTSTINSFTDMAIGSAISPLSAEVRFCNLDCSEYYSLIFGDGSVFGDTKINGAGSTRPIVSRTSESMWTISFPPGTIGRLWNRTPEVPTSELYYYEGTLEINKQ